jgi:general secretion pathway protein G
MKIFAAFVACTSIAFAIRRCVPSVDDGRRGYAKAQIANLSEKIRRYASDKGHMPTSLKQLVEISSDGRRTVGEQDLRDPYGHEFVYRVPGAHGDFDIVYLGKDGVLGGSRYDADIGNWGLSVDSP